METVVSENGMENILRQKPSAGEYSTIPPGTLGQLGRFIGADDGEFQHCLAG